VPPAAAMLLFRPQALLGAILLRAMSAAQRGTTG
jgi:hypothetical protein